MALCCLLAFWTAGDPTRVDRLFRQSGLLREKWDEVHFADGATYGERTVERACARTTEGYSKS
jgi:primase-polymerase (primpol)-like protein